jgi:hypothetical protein
LRMGMEPGAETKRIRGVAAALSVEESCRGLDCLTA